MTRRDRPTPLRRSGGVLLAVLALAGCGDDEQGSETSRLIEEASRTTLAKGTARQHLDFRTEPGRKLAFSLDGLVDMAADDERGTIRYDSFEGVAPGTEVEYVTFDEIDYFREAGTESWLKTETTEQDALANSSDIPSGLRRLGAVTNDARPVGRETIRGVPTTKYEARADLVQSLRTVPPEQRDEALKLARIHKKKEMPAQVWIDSGGAIRRLRYDLDFDNLRIPSNGEDTIVVVVDLFEFGVDARIQPPPPEQTVEE
jgi:hypothetical protein